MAPGGIGLAPEDGRPAGRKDILGDVLPEAIKTEAAEAVLGKPIEVGAVRFVPIASYWFGGLGGRPGAADAEPGFAAAVCAVHPVAVAVVRGDDVAIYSLRGPGLAEQLKELLETVRGALTGSPTGGGRGSGPDDPQRTSDQVAGSTSSVPSGPSNPA